MAGKNNLVKLLQDARNKGFAQGFGMGLQFGNDLTQMGLHELEGFGYARIKRLHEWYNENKDYWADALILCMEQDVRQEQMDRKLLEIIQDNEQFHPFPERYPGVKSLGYNKLPGWVVKLEGNE